MNLYTRFTEIAAAQSETLALTDASERLTYTDLDRGTAAVARGLWEQGLRPGDRVLVAQPLSARLYVLLGGIFRAGAVALVPDASAGWQAVRRAIGQAAPVAAVGPTRRLLLLGLLPEARALRLLSTHRLSRSGGKEETIALDDSAPALLTHTSGSTGAPRLAVRSHGCLLAQDEAVRAALDLQPGQVDVATLAVFALASLSAGATVLLPAPGDLRALRHAVAGATRLTASPGVFTRLLATDAHVLRNLQHAYTGGAPVLPSLLMDLRAAAPEARVAALYGSTEAEPLASLDAHALTVAEVEATARGEGLLAGHLEPGVQLALLDSTGAGGTCSAEAFCRQQVPVGAVGEITVAGAHVVPGYWQGNGDAETKIDAEGVRWHRTGDLGRLDAQGRLWLHGRHAAQVEDARGNLHPLAVEAAARMVPGVDQAALVPGQRCLVFDGRAEAGAVRHALSWADLDRVQRVARVPLDRRHQAKPDYGAIRKRWGKPG